jgi:hypothetical protein
MNDRLQKKDSSLISSTPSECTFEIRQSEIKREKIMLKDLNGRYVAGFFNRCRVFQPTIILSARNKRLWLAQLGISYADTIRKLIEDHETLDTAQFNQMAIRKRVDLDS